MHMTYKIGDIVYSKRDGDEKGTGYIVDVVPLNKSALRPDGCDGYIVQFFKLERLTFCFHNELQKESE